MCTRSHRIAVKNVTTGDRIPTALILIHGSVTCPCDCAHLTINTNPALTHSSSSSSSSVAEFKHLLALSAGENTLHLTYCHATLTIRLHHTPSNLRRQVIPLYIVCRGHDGGHFQSPSSTSATAQVACRRVDVMLQLVQLVYAEKLHESQVGRRSFRIGGECREFHSELRLEAALEMSEQELWEVLADEIIRVEGPEKVLFNKYVAILGCTRYEGVPDDEPLNLSYETIKRRTKARAAIGGGGLVLFNTGCLYTWPDTVQEVQSAFLNQTPVDMRHFADDSNYRRTFGGCFATNLGSLCHELGHAFDLGHTEEGIMGRSFDATEKMFLPLAAIEKRILPKRSTPGGGGGGGVQRMTQVQRHGAVLRDYLREKQCNGIYFARNCVEILAHHKWLQEEEDVVKVPLRYSAKEQMVIAGHPLRVVELRQIGSEMVKWYWTASMMTDDGKEEQEEKTEFKLPLTGQAAAAVVLRSTSSSRPWILFAIDSRGNCLKCRI